MNGTFRASNLSLGASDKLDLNDNDLVVSYGTNPDSFTDIQTLIATGYSAEPDSSKVGITSTTGQNSGGKTILALFDNALVGATEWPPGSGETIDANCVLGKYTYFGDVDLDGQVAGGDYAIIDANLDTTPAIGLAWLAGDANLDGNVTDDDYGVLDANLGLGVGNPLAPTSLVPEPESAVSSLLVGALLKRRRRGTG